METNQGTYQKLPEPKTDKEKKIREQLRTYQGFILDGLEMLYKDTPQWPSARRTVLKAFGESGLELNLRQIINT